MNIHHDWGGYCVLFWYSLGDKLSFPGLGFIVISPSVKPPLLCIQSCRRHFGHRAGHKKSFKYLATYSQLYIFKYGGK